MKKSLPFILLVLCFYSLKASRTFFSIPVPFHPTSPERQTMTHTQMCDWTQEKRHQFSVILLGGKSTEPSRLAQYFLPFNKTCLIAGELGSEPVQNHEVDLIANYFNVLTGSPRQSSGVADNIFDIIDTWTFQSKLQFCPSHSYFGLGLVYRQQLSAEFNKGWWFELAMPIMCIKNDMGMCETIEKCGGPNGDDPQTEQSFFSTSSNDHAYYCMTDALRSAVLKYGKIDYREYRRKKWGVADLEIRVGYTYFKEHNYHLSSYAGFLLPTGNKPNAQYMFEKVIGYNNHTAFFMGTYGGIKVWEHDANFLSFEFDTGSTLFFDNNQVRSFDMYGKPWGRYIWVYPSDNKHAILAPGINYFTKPVRVHYGSIRNLNLAFCYNMSNFQGELGYHFYSRDNESLCLAKNWCEDPALAALWYSDNTFIGSGERRVSRTNAIIDNFNEVSNDLIEFKAFPVTANMTADEVQARVTNLCNNDLYLPIKSCQLNLDSATHPSVVIHTVYGSLGYGWYDIVFPTFINIAGGYEFGDGPAVMDRWKLWFKVGISF